MTVNELIQAIANQLKALYPDRLVYVDEIPNGTDGNHFVHCIDQSHDKKLDRRRMRSYSFEIRYFQKKKDNMAFNDWAETLYDAFEMLDVNGTLVHTTSAHSEPGDDMVFHFIFGVDVNGVIAPVTGEKMNDLHLSGGLKE